eukprot:7295369-Prymnesium_polylepis.1
MEMMTVPADAIIGSVIGPANLRASAVRDDAVAGRGLVRMHAKWRRARACGAGRAWRSARRPRARWPLPALARRHVHVPCPMSHVHVPGPMVDVCAGAPDIIDGGSQDDRAREREVLDDRVAVADHEADEDAAERAEEGDEPRERRPAVQQVGAYPERWARGERGGPRQRNIPVGRAREQAAARSVSSSGGRRTHRDVDQQRVAGKLH